MPLTNADCCCAQAGTSDPSTASGRGHVDAKLLRTLLADEVGLRRELAAEAPLFAFNLVSIQPSGALTASRDVICRLAGA